MSNRTLVIIAIFIVAFFAALSFVCNEMNGNNEEGHRAYREKVSEEGRAAFRAGITAEANPYRRSDTDAVRWLNGWIEEKVKVETERRAKPLPKGPEETDEPPLFDENARKKWEQWERDQWKRFPPIPCRSCPEVLHPPKRIEPEAPPVVAPPPIIVPPVVKPPENAGEWPKVVDYFGNPAPRWKPQPPQPWQFRKSYCAVCGVESFAYRCPKCEATWRLRRDPDPIIPAGD